MVNQNFKSAISIDKPATEVFATILNVRSWWSGLFEESFEGNSENLGDEFSFRAGGGLHYSKQKLIELVPNEKLVWLVTEANLSFLEKTDEWVGTKISFTLSSNNQSTEVLFEHAGLTPAFECYDSCAPAWTQYIQLQLFRLLNKTAP